MRLEQKYLRNGGNGNTSPFVRLFHVKVYHWNRSKCLEWRECLQQLALWINMILGARDEGCNIELLHKHVDSMNTIFRTFQHSIKFINQIPAYFHFQLEIHTYCLIPVNKQKK